jgi:glycosyltransferase involved in cell wall biosynthesis
MSLTMEPGASRRRRIAIFTERFPGCGGGISTAHEGLGELLATRNDVCFFAFEPSTLPSEPQIQRTRGNRLLGSILAGFLKWKVRRHAPQGRITVVQRIGETMAAVRGLQRGLADFQPDFVIMSDDRLPLLGLSVPRGAKVIWVAHHNYIRFMDHPFVQVECPYDLFLAHRLERRAVRRSDYAVFPSAWMEQVFRKSLSETLPGRVIRNLLPTMPVLPERETIRASLNLGNGDLGVFLPSGGTAVKGARFIPEIIRRVSSAAAGCFFVISGPVGGVLEHELRGLQKRFRIISEGAVSRDRVLALAKACDVCVSPALLENYSCALLECQTMGLPVVTFRVGGNAEIVQDGGTGWLTDMADIDAMVLRTVGLLANSEHRNQMSHAAVEQAARLSDRNTILSEWEAVFATVNRAEGSLGRCN